MPHYQAVRALISARVVSAAHVMALRRQGWNWMEIRLSVEIPAIT